LDEKKYDEALKLLEQTHPESFAGMYADLRGDVLVAQGKAAEAKEAYKLALEKLPAQSTYRLVVQVKLDGLGGAQ
jgi:predicted negative regulator of RcsB-dependent stress response